MVNSELPDGLQVIYKPGPRAHEYGEAAANLYSGCPHGCVYCYVPAIVHRTRIEFQQVVPRYGLLLKLVNDCRKLQRALFRGRVHLCFTCDPYPAMEQAVGLTRNVLEMLHRHGIKYQVLTKNPTLAMRDFDLYLPGDRFGVTLTCDNQASSSIYEPGANDPAARIAALGYAVSRGIETWVSLEPVIHSTETLVMARFALGAGCREFHVGPDNHCNSRKFGVAWADLVTELTDMTRARGARLLVKEDLQKLLIAAGRSDLSKGAL